MRRKVVKNSDVCYRDRLIILQQYKKQYGTMTKAAQAMGVSLAQASFLLRLAKVPKEIQQALDDRTNPIFHGGASCGSSSMFWLWWTAGH